MSPFYLSIFMCLYLEAHRFAGWASTVINKFSSEFIFSTRKRDSFSYDRIGCCTCCLQRRADHQKLCDVLGSEQSDKPAPVHHGNCFCARLLQAYERRLDHFMRVNRWHVAADHIYDGRVLSLLRERPDEIVAGQQTDKL